MLAGRAAAVYVSLLLCYFSPLFWSFCARCTLSFILVWWLFEQLGSGHLIFKLPWQHVWDELGRPFKQHTEP